MAELTTLFDILGEPMLVDQPIGVRVNVWVEDSNGVGRWISVTVNATQDMTLAELNAHVEMYVNNTSFDGGTTGAYRATLVYSDLAALYAGGLESPALDLTSL